MTRHTPPHLADSAYFYRHGINLAVDSYFHTKEAMLLRHKLEWVIWTDFDGGMDDRGEPVCIAHNTTFSELELQAVVAHQRNHIFVERGKQAGHGVMQLLIDSSIFERRTRNHWLFKVAVWVSWRNRQISDFLLAIRRISWYYWSARHSTFERNSDAE